jgi:hypothetical protein
VGVAPQISAYAIDYANRANTAFVAANTVQLNTR